MRGARRDKPLGSRVRTRLTGAAQGQGDPQPVGWGQEA
jgi:hypothetical protein